MLILRRKKNESFLIGGNVRITIIDCATDGVRVAIDAPKQISILREELSEMEQATKSAVIPADIHSLCSLQSMIHSNETDDCDA